METGEMVMMWKLLKQLNSTFNPHTFTSQNEPVIPVSEKRFFVPEHFVVW